MVLAFISPKCTLYIPLSLFHPFIFLLSIFFYFSCARVNISFPLFSNARPCVCERVIAILFSFSIEYYNGMQ